MNKKKVIFKNNYEKIESAINIASFNSLLSILIWLLKKGMIFSVGILPTSSSFAIGQPP